MHITIHADDATKARAALDAAGILHSMGDTLSDPAPLAPRPKRQRPRKAAPKKPAKLATDAARAAVLAFVTAHPDGIRSQDVPGVPASQRKYALRSLVKSGEVKQKGKAGGARFFPATVEHRGQSLVKVPRKPKAAARPPVKVRDAKTKAPKREVVPEPMERGAE